MKSKANRGQKGSWDVRGGDDGSTTATVGALDTSDCLYDSEEERQRKGGIVLVSPGVAGSPPRNSYLPEMGRVLVGPPLTLSKFKRQMLKNKNTKQHLTYWNTETTVHVLNN